VVRDYTANYLVCYGVKGGRNTLEFRERRMGGVGQMRVKIRRRSGIGTTAIPPVELFLDARPAAGTVGEPMKVRFELTRRGARRDQRAAVELSGIGRDFSVKSPNPVRFRRVGAGRAGSFTVVPHKAERYLLFVGVTGSYNSPSDVARVSVTRKSP